MPLSPVSKAIIAIGISIVALIIIFIIVMVAVGPALFPLLMQDAAFQDCLTISTMLPIESKNQIVTAAQTCATENRVSIIDVTFEPLNSNEAIIANVDYSVPVTTTFKLNRSVEKKYTLSK